MIVEEQSEKDEDLGIAPKIHTIGVSMNLNHIVSHFRGIDGYTHITLSDDREHVSEIEYEEFLDILDECYMRIELNVGTN
jgi:hypothetical protein